MSGFALFLCCDLLEPRTAWRNSTSKLVCHVMSTSVYSFNLKQTSNSCFTLTGSLGTVEEFSGQFLQPLDNPRAYERKTLFSRNKETCL
jgi:hypothetical protein